MTCWHCNKDLVLDYQSPDFTVKVYTCPPCDKWYEMRKQKARLNAAVPISFYEIEAPGQDIRKAA
jgi:hypothetical protein